MFLVCLPRKKKTLEETVIVNHDAMPVTIVMWRLIYQNPETQKVKIPFFQSACFRYKSFNQPSPPYSVCFFLHKLGGVKRPD